MRFIQLMERNGDNVWLAGMGTIIGLATGLHWIAQLAASLLTMIAGAVILHFVKRELNQRWPIKRLETDEGE
jgi:hypothetical protein